MKWNRLLFIQIQTGLLSMHHKWKEIIDIVEKQPNENIGDQLLT